MDFLIYLALSEEQRQFLDLPKKPIGLPYHITLWRKEGMARNFWDEFFPPRILTIHNPFSLYFHPESEMFSKSSKVYRVDLERSRDFENFIVSLNTRLMLRGFVNNSLYLGTGEMLDLNGRVVEKGPGYNPHMTVPTDFRICPSKLREPISFEGCYVSSRSSLDGGWSNGIHFGFDS